MNIGKLQTHFRELILTLSPYLSKIDILILTETWHHPTFPYSFSLTGFNSFFTNLKHNEASGIAVYARSDLNIQTEELTNFTMTNCLKLDLTLKDQHLTVLTMYRHPSGNIPSFFEKLDEYISQLICDRCLLILLIGDININILEENIGDIGHDYLDILHQHNSIPTVTKPTRVKVNQRRNEQTTFTTISCRCTKVDHVMYKSRSMNEIISAIIHTDITDHFSTLTKIDLEKQRIKEQTKHYTRFVCFV